ncbi:DUF6161 domain-containing protein [Yoonia sp. I 8.24]|uniref:DUF6161 domain-containing protein n=1 Tax=Yoonia sp. I 8.24 TaxID=1537229 RepID=UPI001EDDC555|nr:DUF6161 domain-containing protein [Yoonia sp. I 8.24]MCG3266828.1 hypothetical protein [Yoonia sp. I 8.24]
MTTQDYVITYRSVPNVSFPTSAGMKRYLETEAAIWSGFLDEVRVATVVTETVFGRGKQTVGAMVDAFKKLDELLDNPKLFNNITQRQSNGILPPPPSSSIEAQLIFGLVKMKRSADALSAYLQFTLGHSNEIAHDNRSRIREHLTKGETFIAAAYASAALPFQQLTDTNVASATQTANAHMVALQDEVLKAQKANAENESALERQNEKFGEMLQLFHTHLKLKAPAELWESRATLHDRKSKWALWGFIATTIFAILAGAGIPFLAGDYIADSFYMQACDTCVREFSAKGPVTVSGMLIIMSLLMWAIRLQYRVYLSERHLALDASEKNAFVRTYLAMREGDDVGSDNEAIVLASLFRPTQDGIIKDDESGFDLSATALLAKQLGRNGQ